jgi:anti-anti-sigma regulatory factor
MTGTPLEVGTGHDGTLTIQPHGHLTLTDSAALRHLLVRAIRHDRPRRLSLDLGDVGDLDPISLGTIAAACHLGEDSHIPVFLDNASTAVAAKLAGAGVPPDRIRHTSASGRPCPPVLATCAVNPDPRGRRLSGRPRSARASAGSGGRAVPPTPSPVHP